MVSLNSDVMSYFINKYATFFLIAQSCEFYFLVIFNYIFSMF